MMMLGKFVVLGLIASTGTLAVAQSFPTKPVRIVVGFVAGGATDTVARLVAQQLSERLGKSAVVENRAGASGTIGAELVAKRPLTVEQVPRALARGCDPVAGCKRRTQNRGRMRAYAVASP